jgi:hypothetical protein
MRRSSLLTREDGGTAETSEAGEQTHDYYVQINSACLILLLLVGRHRHGRAGNELYYVVKVE